MSIIGLSGKIGSGKDLTASIIQYLTTRLDMSFSSFLLLSKEEQEYNWKVKKFAGKLKQMVSLLTGISIEDLEKEEVKDSYLGEQWDHPSFNNKPTVRNMLQRLGTEALREIIHPNVHINALFSDYNINPNKSSKEMFNEFVIYGETRVAIKYPNWIISDLRFPNEAQAIKERDGILIRINRPCSLCKQIKGHDPLCSKVSKLEHDSETALDNYQDWDYIINNDSSIEDLVKKVKDILIKEKII